MKNTKQYSRTLLAGLLLAALPAVAIAGVIVQCPGDADGSADWNGKEVQPDGVRCMHLSAGDGFATMGDGVEQYIFGFADVTGLPTRSQKQKDTLTQAGLLAHTWPAPTIELAEGEEFYLNLTNVGMVIRPDLFDPHTVHFHGFPQSSTVFDGLPESGLSIGMNATLTYYYKLNDPGTYMYHCHVEATEHMQMGMLGNLYVKPAQDGTAFGGFTQFAYNDGDGTTGYDVAYPIQLGSFDSAFHNASVSTQALPFALMKDNYPMINGRGYPDTVDPRGENFPSSPSSAANNKNPVVKTSQPVSSLIVASAGQHVLLRISNLAITRFYTLQSLGLPMRVVGKDAKHLRSQNGMDLYYTTNSVTLGGGESYDVILEVPGTAQAGDTFFLYSANLNYLSNDTEPYGGMMTEIRIN